MLLLATGAWLLCFAVLASRGTWIQFAVAGAVLASSSVVVRAVEARRLHLSVPNISVGLVAGTLMVLFTHLTYGMLAPVVPNLRDATVELVRLIHCNSFSPAARVGLVAIIATCEEVLFRGPLAGGSLPRNVRAPSPAELLHIVLLATVYALATATLGSPLLVLTAFLCGVAWGVLCVCTGSLVAPIVAHIVWDLGVLVLWPMAASA